MYKMGRLESSGGRKREQLGLEDIMGALPYFIIPHVWLDEAMTGRYPSTSLLGTERFAKLPSLYYLALRRRIR